MLILILLLPLAACGNRTITRPDADNHSGLDNQPAIGKSTIQSAPPTAMVATGPPSASPSHPDSRTAPAANAPASNALVKTSVPVQPSRSLAGHDRFLVSRPLSLVRPADFELGLLLDRKTDLRFVPLLDGLAKAFTKKTFKAAAFSTQALVLAELLYSPELASAPLVTHVRFSEAKRQPGATHTLGIRLFSESGSALGLVILGTDDEDNLLIEHLDLELRGLGEQTTRSTPWDPYGYSRTVFD